MLLKNLQCLQCLLISITSLNLKANVAHVWNRVPFVRSLFFQKYVYLTELCMQGRAAAAQLSISHRSIWFPWCLPTSNLLHPSCPSASKRTGFGYRSCLNEHCIHPSNALRSTVFGAKKNPYSSKIASYATHGPVVLGIPYRPWKTHVVPRLELISYSINTSISKLLNPI